ncbi:16S rRNA (cytidine(1402)-2'-O)-methyltransferase [Algiphilus sp.]|uniref:16S rRNA (cytidine(1402)-2'-O)-methyltransferase n=1 Tax=Algiphilus sp. TaxID=1872431 RepID=UPI003B5290B3
MNPANEGAAEAGTLYIVPTPIGNLSDLSPRALRVLDGVDVVAAEDTRTTGAMLSHFGIRARLTALHEHNESQVVGSLLARLAEAHSVALVSDAGTPLISDPGYRLVDAVRDAGHPVVALPGPCAAVAALSAAGLPSDAFSFFGFPPPKASARRDWLQAHAHWPHTMVMYESSHRIQGLADDLGRVFGRERRVALSREISKRFEEHWRGEASALSGWLAEDENRLRGEFVVMIAPGAPPDPAEAIDRLLKPLLRELEPSRAARVVASALGERRNTVYRRAMELAGDAPPAAKE